MKIPRLWITFIGLTILLMAVHPNVNSTHIIQNNFRASQSTEVKSSYNPKTHIHIIKSRQSVYPAISKTKIRQYLHQMQTQTLNDIQSDRSLHGIPPITLNSKLNHLAQIRTKQIAQRFSHYDHEGHPYTTDDANTVHLPHGFKGAENIASTGLGNCITIGDPKTYHNHNGKQMAEMANDAMMNHDQLEANGHRKNILDQGNTLVGISATYNPNKHEFYLAEDFGNHNPESSEDINQTTTNQINKSKFLIVFRTIKQNISQIFNQSLHFVKKLFRI